MEQEVFWQCSEKKKVCIQSLVEQMAIQIGDFSRMKILEGEVNILLDKEGKMWRQRSKVLWLKDVYKSLLLVILAVLLCAMI